MIQSEMNLELSVDTESVKTTVDASLLDDDEILPYCVGYIPWHLMQQSTLWAWRRYQYDYSYGAQTASITPLANPYDSDDALQAANGVSFCYAANSSLAYPELKAIERLPDGTFTGAGDSFSESYGNLPLKKNLIAAFDLSKITKTSYSNNLTTYVCFATAWEVVTAQGDGPYGCYIKNVTDYDFKSGSFTPYTTNQIIGSPVNDTLAYTVNSAVLDLISEDGAPYEDQVTVNGYTVKLRTYCIGFRFSCRLVGSNISYTVNGMTCSDLLYRYTPMMGVQSVNGAASGSYPFYSSSSYKKKPTEIGQTYSRTAVSDTGYINIGRDIVGDSFTLDNNGKYVSTENGMRYKDSLQFWIGFKSFNAMDLRIMGLITTPVYTDANGDSWCPEFTNDYALTGNWVPYVDQVIDPEDNTFDPEDIPEPSEGVVPHLTAFIVDGMGADFRQIYDETPLSIPDGLTFRMPDSQGMYFDFAVKGVM